MAFLSLPLPDLLRSGEFRLFFVLPSGAIFALAGSVAWRLGYGTGRKPSVELEGVL